MIEKYTIVGCGLIGSELAILFSLYSHHSKNNLLVTLFDYDEVEEKNLPYAYTSKEEYIGINKTSVLIEQCNSLSSKLEGKIDFYHNKNKYIPNKGFNKSSETILIDCRDTSDSSEEFHYKLNYDGDIGSIVVSPKNNDGERGRYLFEIKKYRMIPIVSQMFNFIISNTDYSHRRYNMVLEDPFSKYSELPNVSLLR